MNKKLKWYQQINEHNEISLDLNRILKTALFGIALIFVLISALQFGLSYYANETVLPPNEIGDSFGLVNALFSALAFAFLIYTSLLQTEELKLQRKELEENRKELARAADAHDASLQIQTLVNAEFLVPDLIIELQSDAFKPTILNISPAAAPVLIEQLLTDSSEIELQNDEWLFKRKQMKIKLPMPKDFSKGYIIEIILRTVPGNRYSYLYDGISKHSIKKPIINQLPPRVRQ